MNRPEYIDNPELIQIREGFSLLDLKRYVDARGYRGLGFGKMKFEDLVNKAPALVAINTFGYNHFVIFRGTRGNRVLLADPAWGNRTMLIDEFIESWIEYPNIGRTGFVVERRDGLKSLSPLGNNSKDYVMLR
jgi:predicted double-glycine peptidase